MLLDHSAYLGTMIAGKTTSFQQKKIQNNYTYKIPIPTPQLFYPKMYNFQQNHKERN